MTQNTYVIITCLGNGCSMLVEVYVAVNDDAEQLISDGLMDRELLATSTVVTAATDLRWVAVLSVIKSDI